MLSIKNACKWLFSDTIKWQTFRSFYLTVRHLENGEQCCHCSAGFIIIIICLGRDKDYRWLDGFMNSHDLIV